MSARDAHGHARASVATFASGEVLGGTYRIVGTLETGGMGSLFLAEHVRLGRRFVVKVLANHAKSDPEAIGRFHREAEVVSQLHHPNIVQVIDFDTAPSGDPYLVLEYLGGESLSARLEREVRLDIERAVAIAWQIASALATAHEQGVVHRDLKPANIYLVAARGHDSFVKVLDFGISKQLGKSRSYTRELEVVGTPSYMAPEQALARGIDHRTDQFALACIVYRMLSGEIPFIGPSVAETLSNVVSSPTPTLGDRFAGVPRAVDVVLARAMAKDPQRRFAKISDFAWALSEASQVRQLAIGFRSEPPPPPGPTLRPPRSTSPTLAAEERPVSGFIRTPPKHLTDPDGVAYLLDAARAALEDGDPSAAGTLAEEAARRVEEGSADSRHAVAIRELFEQLLGGVEHSFSRAQSPALGDLTPKLAFVLSRVEGTTSARELIDAAHLPEHELLHALYVLTRRGLLRTS